MEKWIIAVSGGPDSMALLDKMRHKGVECFVAHVNYNMRETSLRDQQIVERYCEKYSLHYELLILSGEKRKGNFQEFAREIRYKFFKEQVLKHRAQGVMVAHHLNDDIETFIMQKRKNVSTTNVGITSQIVIDGITISRPLLKETKASLLDYCISRGIEYGIDESNLKPTYVRNEIRISLEKLSEEQLLELKSEMETKRALAKDVLVQFEVKFGKLGTKVSVETFKSSEELRYWLVSNGVKVFNASKLYLEEMLRNFKKNKGIYEFEDLIVYSQYGFLYIHKIAPTYQVLDSLQYGNFSTFKLSESGNRIEGISVSESDFPLTFRNPMPGDKIKLRIGSKSISRFFVDRKIPYGERKNWLIVENRKGDIVFVVGIGCDIHHYSNNSNLFVIKL